VFLVPHSHNDPGWLKTFESYYHSQTRMILNNMVEKLVQHPNMTFIWSEISFFSQWWESVHPTKRNIVKKLIAEGRLEMVTGGWVMTDEATSHIFAMVDQLIEGHQWLKNNLGIQPRSGWSVDPFGHGATVPYLLKSSGFEGGAVIQRIHYAWKRWFAEQEMGDFKWRQTWDNDGHTDFLVHNMPFDIYSIKHSCGPHPQICLSYDFRKVPGEYTEYSMRSVPIDNENVKQKAETLLEEYGRTGSLFPHNTVMTLLGDDFRYDRDMEWDQQYRNYKKLFDYINSHKHIYNAEVSFGTPSDYFTNTEYSMRSVPIDNENVKQKAETLLEEYGRTGSLFPHNTVMTLLGDDFRYDRDMEWDQQYRNYKKLFDYINSHKHIYNAEVSFGTPSDYFNAVRERMSSFKTLKGDFFVYSDIFAEAYWSGYYTTRPYWKILDRELESNLRSAEILYTVALNKARKQCYNNTVKVLERDYEKLVRARQSLGLFQHHDAITGTSKAYVMHDYALKLYEGIQDSIFVQGFSAQSLLLHSDNTPSSSNTCLLVPSSDRESYEKLPHKIVINFHNDEPKKVVLFNSLGQHRQDVIRLKVSKPNVRVLSPDGGPVIYQINPVWNSSQPETTAEQPSETTIEMVRNQYELEFVVELPPLSLMVYTIEVIPRKQNLEAHAIVYCKKCHRHSSFITKNMLTGDIQLENHVLKLLIDGNSGLLRSITQKKTNKVTHCGLEFSAYTSAQFHSGAYLFMPEPNTRDSEREILDDIPNHKIVITSGPVSSQLIVLYGNLLVHTITIYHVSGPLSQGIYIENIVDFDIPPKNRETELFMRFNSDLMNGEPPEFYTDLNGLSMQRRVKVERINIEGNYFPITTSAFIQDPDRRLTLLVNHAQGAAAWQPGWLEVMLDRRTLYDDARGMGEGIVDNKRTLCKYWLLLEDISSVDPSLYQSPSLVANQLSNGLNYPPNIFILESSDTSIKQDQLRSEVFLVSKPLPCDVHLMNFRTLADQTFMQFPSSSSLMLLQRQGFACNVGSDYSIPKCSLNTNPKSNPSAFHSKTLFNDLHVSSIRKTSLTGLRSEEEITYLRLVSINI
ncbi:LOW QUALITY PROTEIN: alpha-mannosidase 2x, partial [Diaphorina citri]|uniref:Alpha-mannosidase n=2 Tax=Diaphorina citri TaxID=121845 RepID=A0A3Q0IV30_DIACI